MRAFPLILLLIIAVSLGGCASRAKSSHRIYDGDSPSIHMTERQRVGGPAS